VDIHERRKDLKELYKKRRCFWCKRSVEDCESKCQCVYCVFDDKFDSVKDEHPNISNWLENNSKFYIKLFKEGLAKESILARKWRHHQLDRIEKTGTRINEWVPHFEIDGESKLIPEPP